jgi:putative salt-induced outer membrane protein
MEEHAMKTIAAAATALTLLPAPAPAFAEPKTDGEWRGTLSLNLNFSSGNTDSSNAGLGADAVRATNLDKISLAATAQRGESTTDGVTTKTADLAKLGGRYDRNLSEQVFGFGGLDLEHDKLQQLDLRTSLNAGLGYHVLSDKETTFDVFGGLGGTHEDYEASSRDFAEIILGEESTHKLWEGTSFKQRLAVYPNLDDTGEYRANFDATMATAIAAGWTFNVTLSSRYQSNPQPGIGTTDTLLLVGVASKFGPK